MSYKGDGSMRESRYVEYKEDISNSFLKTVSAFANYQGGTIKFGIRDNGEVVGMRNPEQACLDIENKMGQSLFLWDEMNNSLAS